MNDPADIVIVGAGVAGLCLADRLAASGRSVRVIERAGVPGGLARSYRYEGHVFDVGPHRFYTTSPEVEAYLRSVSGVRYREVSRSSGLYAFGRFFGWPPRVRDGLRLPPRVALGIARDLLPLRRSRPSSGDEGFDGWVTARYGPTLYEAFFRPFAEKFFGRPARDVTASFAEVGIDRAVIDERVRGDSLLALAWSNLRPQPAMRFLYPEGGGMGVFAERLAANLADRGVILELGAPVQALEMDGGRVSAVETATGRYPCQTLVWTGALDGLARLLGLETGELEFLDLLLFNVRLSHPPRIPYQWCYFAPPEVPFTRVSVPSLFDPSLSPPGRSSLCVERTLRPSESATLPVAEAEREVRHSLVELGLADDARSIEGISVERVPEAYPVHTRGAMDRRRTLVRELGRFENLHLLGRSGSYWYNNMDQSIEAALALSARLCS